MQLVLNICTLIVSLISLLTLIEMVRQRRSSMMPNVFLPVEYNLQLSVSEGDKDDYNFPFRWSGCDINQIDYNLRWPEFKIELTNVGKGTAVNIVYEWELDIQYYLDKIYKDVKFHEIDITYDNDKQSLHYYTQGLGLNTPGLKNEDFKIPFLYEAQTVSVNLCAEFVILFSTLYFVIWDESKKINEKVLDFSTHIKELQYPELIIKYQDISGKKYKKKFLFSMDQILGSYNESRFILKIY